MARRFAAAFACWRRIFAGSRASIWSSFLKARAAISADFAANAARRSSTATGRTGSRRRTFRKTPRRNTASRWRCSTIRRCGLSCTASSPARRRGSRSPTTCRNIRTIRRRSCASPSPAGGGSTATGGRGGVRGGAGIRSALARAFTPSRRPSGGDLPPPGEGGKYRHFLCHYPIDNGPR